MQKQNDIADKRIGRFLAQDDFKVGPQDLRAEPGGKAQPHQDPEKSRAAVAIENVQTDADCSCQQKRILREIANRGKNETVRDEPRQQYLRKYRRAGQQNPRFSGRARTD